MAISESSRRLRGVKLGSALFAGAFLVFLSSAALAVKTAADGDYMSLFFGEEKAIPRHEVHTSACPEGSPPMEKPDYGIIFSEISQDFEPQCTRLFANGAPYPYAVSESDGTVYEIGRAHV